MAIDGLPQSLEELMCFLIKSSVIKSWNYYGGQTHNTLTIRWVSNSSVDCELSQEHVSFKRKSDSQMLRDTKRLDDWKLRKENYGNDLVENKSAIFTNVTDPLSHIQDTTIPNSSPVASMDNAFTPISQTSCDNSDQLTDCSESLLQSSPKEAEDSEPGASNAFKPRLSNGYTEMQGANPVEYSDDCSKCRRWKVHTSRTDHNLVMRTVHDGKPFVRKCFDCSDVLINTSSDTWMSDMNCCIYKCSDCTDNRELMRNTRNYSCLLCQRCGSKHRNNSIGSKHSLIRGKLRFNLKNNRMGFYFLEVG